MTKLLDIMKMKIPTTLIMLLLAAAATANAGSITVKGSDTLVILAQKWAEVYMGQKPDVKIQVTGGGSGTGFAALQNQATDLCNASRKIKAKEIESCVKAFNKRPTEYKVAIDGLSVYVSADNPVKELSLDQLELIFTGKIKNWKELGGADAPVVVVGRDSSSGTFESWQELVMGKTRVSQRALLQSSSGGVVQAVAGNPNAIGYIGVGYLDSQIKGLVVNGVQPGAKTAQDGTWPISRELYLFTSGQPQGDAKKLVDYTLSAEGQQFVSKSGFVPLK